MQDCYMGMPVVMIIMRGSINKFWMKLITESMGFTLIFILKNLQIYVVKISHWIQKITHYEASPVQFQVNQERPCNVLNNLSSPNLYQYKTSWIYPKNTYNICGNIYQKIELKTDLKTSNNFNIKCMWYY